MIKNILDEEERVSPLRDITNSIILGFRFHPILLSICAFTSMLHSMSYAVITLASQNLFDEVTFLAKGAAINSTRWAIVLMGLSYVGSQLIMAVDTTLYVYIHRKVLGRLYEKLHDKSSKISPINYDDPQSLDLIEKAKTGIRATVDTAFSWLNMIAYFLSYFIAMFFVLHSISPSLIVCLFVAFIPVIISQWIRLKLFTDLEDESAPIRRKMEQYENAICRNQYYKETRVLGAFNYINNLYSDSIQLLNATRWKFEKKANTFLLISRLLTVLGYISIILLLVYLLYMHRISIGGFAAVLSSLYIMFSMAENMLGVEFGLLAKNAAQAKNLFKFLRLKEQVGTDGEFKKELGITVSDVHFTYPHAGKEALKGISLSIQPNEIVAIVGGNGAGKSTLVKLLMGMYLPDKGTVTVGGMDTKIIQSEYIYRRFSAVFQNFIKYKMTLLENITISDAEVSEEQQNKKARQAAKQIDLNLQSNSFPNGFETMLSREFDGVDLSGGEWQRLAIARGLYRIHDIIILDEPTAAIDPLEEFRIYESFSRISKNKMSIIVTHRIGAARLASKIIVLNEGKIEEEGTHEELMEAEGLYSRMYRSQKQWYDTLAITD
ncbi:ABC transporter ATP-binding protein/permease [Bacillus sp. IITD106]|nr:ABC transporter ATP-binding protein/permease [Bacillus sp. IITD106]